MVRLWTACSLNKRSASMGAAATLPERGLRRDAMKTKYF